MPGKNNRKGQKFIDKKKDVIHHFHVVQRSQQDPLVVDETAPQGVLVDKNCENDPKEAARKYGVYFDDDYNYLQHLRGAKEAVEWENAEVEVYTLRKKDPRENSKKSLKKGSLQLPSSAFESYMEEPIGLLNKAAPLYGPQPDLDPDVVAGLDTSDFEDGDEAELPDDFVMMLNSEEPVHDLDACENDGGVGVAAWLSSGVPTNGNKLNFDEELYKNCESGDVGWEDCDEEDDAASREGCFYDSDDGEGVCSHYEDEERDEVGSLNGIQKTYRSEGAKSQFTNYSLSSSVLPRSELLSLLDDQFEEKFLKEYDDDHVGPLDMEDIDGFLGEDSDLFKQAIQKSEKDIEDPNVIKEEHAKVKKWIQHTQKHQIPTDFEQISVTEKEKPDAKWDCESILSTYSNIYNHPKYINTNEIGLSKRQISIDPNTGLPITNKKSKYLNKRNLKELNSDEEDDSADEVSVLQSLISTISMRPKGETAEERRMRKAANKEYRKARREEKKMNQIQFKEEKKKQNTMLVRELNNKRLIKI